MNVFVCIAITLNGLITAGVPHEEWISDVSWGAYLERLRHTDVAVVGSKTYQVLGDEEFPDNLKYIVLTHNNKIKLRPNVQTSSDAPVEIIKKLANQGYNNVGIFGGAEVISDFITAGVVDELFVDVQGIISGTGKNLVLPDTGVYKYQLVDVIKLDSGTAQLHYKKATKTVQD